MSDEKNSFWNAYRSDKKLVEEGVWVDDFEGGASVYLRSPSSLAAREVRRKLEEQEPFRLALKKAARKRTDLPVQLEDQLNKRWLAQGIILGWKNVPDRDGTLLKFSPENALMIFEALPEFYEDIMTAATSKDLFKGEERVEDRGNSKSASTGTSPGE